MASQLQDLARQLGDLAITLEDESSSESTLEGIVKGAVRIIPGARWAGISLVEGKQIEPRVPTDPIVEELDRLQTKLDEGPCLDALRHHHTVHIDDTATDDRWPTFLAEARDRNVASMLSFQLFVTDTTFGALNLYATESTVFDDDSIEFGRILAQHASVALSAITTHTQFKAALGSRDIIGQAKGLIMERFNINGIQAFHLLTRLSQETNVKVIDIARQLVDDHENQTPERPAHT